jgi:uncharacterized protein (DUF1800 family)
MRLDVRLLLGSVLCLSAMPSWRASAAPPPAPIITNFQAQGVSRSLRFDPYPGAENYTIHSSTNVGESFTADSSFALSAYTNAGSTNVGGYEWRSTNGSGSSGFYRVGVTPMADSNLLAATVLHRLTYGPTPDELERIRSIGPDVFIAEQLAPWSITENAELADADIATIGATFAAADELVTTAHAKLQDFRAWHSLRAVNANRQLLESLLQFLENHFVTEYGKTYVHFGQYYNNKPNNLLRRQISTQLEYLENAKWRAALLNPQCTFLDLLRISAESPAMIIYLDTVGSRGDGGRVANENYARELCELFCLGVDNGYDQDDIVELSKAWTGWRMEKVDFANAFNPFAPKTTAPIPGTNTSTEYYNLNGVWAFNYKSQFHNNATKVIFAGKTVPARFGPPWAGQSYQLTLNNGSGTNSIQDGYQVLTHMANLPFTQEYLSVKLCRLLVHDNFPNPTTNTNLPEYAYYDYTRSDLTPEAQLVHACMLTWETNSPKGQIWQVVKTITDSDLFRSQAASLQKVKTPFEYTVSAIRALRSSTNGSNLDGSFTADTDGYSISGNNNNTDDSASSPIIRMGTMMLFDREAPDGYPEDGPPWISAGTLAERVRFIQSTGGNSVNDARNCICRPVDLITSRLLSSADWTNAPVVADYFCRLLYPAEGAANLALYRQSAVDFLNTNDSGGSNPFSGLTVSSDAKSTYDIRVRGMVSLLMTMPRFHEQ